MSLYRVCKAAQHSSLNDNKITKEATDTSATKVTAPVLSVSTPVRFRPSFDQVRFGNFSTSKELKGLRSSFKPVLFPNSPRLNWNRKFLGSFTQKFTIELCPFLLLNFVLFLVKDLFFRISHITHIL